MKFPPPAKSIAKLSVFETDSRTSIRWDVFRIGTAVTATITLLSLGLWLSYVTGSGLTSPAADVPETSDQTALAPPVPPPSPQVVWSKKTLKLAVLNGTGQAGRGGQVAQQARLLGYTVNRIDLAPHQTGSTLSLSSDIASLSGQIKDSLGSIAGNITVATKPEPGVSIAVLILGTDK